MSTENEQTLEFYNKNADLYCLREKKFYAEPQGIKTGEMIKSFLRKSLDEISKDAKLFEIGSGDGRDARFINSLGYDIQVSDAAESFLSILKKKGFSPMKFNVVTDGFPDSYDYILADAVFVHLTKQEVKDAAQKVYNALNIGGRFAVTLKQRIDKGYNWETGIPGTSEKRFFSYWNADEIRTILRDTGFEITYSQQEDGVRAKWLKFIAQKP